MNWIVKFTKQAEKQFNKLDRPIQQRIANFLNHRLKSLDNPKQIGKALQGNLADYWSYRVGDYRLLVAFEDEYLIIVVAELAHRRHVYK
ncbi:MAG: mRNA interferase RelE/StbE [Methyloprofundus sp.]|nr:MAG: mRNA interferase RelE/StbE [Methyloprofundus sp.]